MENVEAAVGRPVPRSAGRYALAMDTGSPFVQQEAVDEDPDDYLIIPDFLFEAAAERDAHLQELTSLSQGLNGHLRPIAEAFCHNLSSVYQLVALPLGLVFQGSEDTWHWFNMVIELLRNYQGRRIKKSEFQELLVRSRTRVYEDFDGVASFIRISLDRVSAQPQFVSASRELLDQGLVLAWSSLEVLASDLFCATINTSPHLAGRVLSDTSVRKYLVPDKISFDLLAEFGFNLSSSMGTILTRDLNLSSVGKIKALASVLFNSEAVRVSLDSRILYLLNERRHLIVHRRGVVDAKYVRATGDGRAEGERFQVDKAELGEALAQVTRCGLDLLRAAEQVE
jgi:hypothetical protein